MARLDIDFILIDESVVLNGFRVLMSGARLQSFLKNPVMLCLHNRALDNEPVTTDVMLPIGKWYDIRIEQGKLLAKPEFDDNDEFALKIQSKVKGGYMNGASIWIEPIAASDDVALALPGQYGVTITEWGVFEASIVDIPNCRNALAIKNAAGNKFLLSGNRDNDANAVEYLNSLVKLSNKKTSMDKKIICAKLGLDENVADAILTAKLDAVLGDAGKLAALNTENTDLKKENSALKLAAVKGKIEALVDGAIAGKKLQAGEREDYIKLATADFDTTKKLLDAMKPYESIEDKLSVVTTDTDKERLSELSKLSGVELYNKGLLEELQKLSLPVFKNKYKEAFGVDYKA